jgi:arsenite methyltransferase
MLDLARDKLLSGARLRRVPKGTVEYIPLPDGSVDVVISNCVINLSVDKPKVIIKRFRLLGPGGPVGISNVAADDDLSAMARAE